MVDKKFTSVSKTLDNSREQIAKGKEHLPNLGTVLWAKDGIICVDGLKGAQINEMVMVVDAECAGLVLQLDGDTAYCALLAHSELVRTGSKVQRLNKEASIPVSEQILGRVIDPLGAPLDNRPEYEPTAFQALETRAPGVMDRQPVETPVQTGILAIDALVPVGRGQRELIIGDRQSGKTTIALDAIINQKGQDMICVYVGIGQRDGKMSQVIKQLQETGAMNYTVVVVASASAPASIQYLAPYAGVAVAEYFMHQGKDVLIVYDDLSKHAVAYRELSLLLRKPPAREAYPGDVFYLHSRLLERAARLSNEKGGGSITALPIIETQAADVSAYIPTNVISITDGQIFLEPKLFYKGIRPAINVGISVSRVGGAAQTKIIKKISGPAKLALAQYYDLAAFAQFSSELDEESKNQLVRGERLVESMKQKAGKPYQLWQESLVLWTAMNGYLDKVKITAVSDKIQNMLSQAEVQAPNLIQAIAKKPELSPEVESMMKQFADSYFEVNK